MRLVLDAAFDDLTGRKRDDSGISPLQKNPMGYDQYGTLSRAL